MEVWKKIGKAFLFPHVALLVCLIPTSIVLLVYALVFTEQTEAISVIAYALSAYTLTAVCFRMPRIIRFIRCLRANNRYWLRWRTDIVWKTNITLTLSLLFNLAYGVFQLGLGLYYHSLWLCAMSVYYGFLTGMRLFLRRYSIKNALGENEQLEWKKYRICGIMTLVMNLALSVIMGIVIIGGKRIEHHLITCIALAAYTFTSFTFAIINMVRYKKYHSPVLSAGKAISMASATVSMFTLETAMLTAFGEADSALFTDIMLTVTGCVVSLFIVVMAIYMCVHSTKKLKEIEEISSGKQ